MKKPIPMLLACLCGCTTLSTTMSRHGDNVYDEAGKVYAARSAEGNDPSGASSSYREYLDRNVKIAAYETYRAQFEEEMDRLEKDENSVISESSVYAFPYYYDLRLDAAINAHLGLARLAGARGDGAAAVEEAKAARDMAADHAISPYRRAAWLVQALDLLRGYYKAQGEAGKALNAGLDRDLLADYMGSRQGAKDRFAEKQDMLNFIDKRPELDEFIDKVNSAREDKVLAQRTELFKSIMRAEQAYGSIKTLSAQYGNMSGLQQISAQMKIMDMADNIGSSGGGKAEAARAQAPSGLLLPGQFSGADSGVRTRDIVRTFASAAAALSGSPEVRKDADEVLRDMDAISEMKKGAGAGGVERVGHFIKALDALKGDIAAVPARGGAGGAARN